MSSKLTNSSFIPIGNAGRILEVVIKSPRSLVMFAACPSGFLRRARQLPRDVFKTDQFFFHPDRKRGSYIRSGHQVTPLPCHVCGLPFGVSAARAATPARCLQN